MRGPSARPSLSRNASRHHRKTISPDALLQVTCNTQPTDPNGLVKGYARHVRTPRRRSTGEFDSVDALLSSARSQLTRLTPVEAQAHVDAGAVIVDTRPAWQREAEGEIPGSVVVERNHLEWRLSPTSEAALPMALDTREWIVICREGYSSSLAAASLRSVGVNATDVIDGFLAWRAAGLPVVEGCTPVEHVVPLPATGDQARLS
jgi:rhodanese-related sulfurtransferase